MKIDQNSFSTHKDSGFTLLEIVVALGLFAVISVVAHSSLFQFINVRDAMEKNTVAFSQVQRGVALLEQDIRYAVSHPVRDAYGDLEPAFLTNLTDPDLDNEIIRLTAALPSYQVKNTNQLSRVAWRLEDGVLIRSFWLVLDRAQDSELKHFKLIDGVSNFSIVSKGYDEDSNLQIIDSEDINTEAYATPSVIEMTLTMDSGREYFRIWEVASES